MRHGLLVGGRGLRGLHHRGLFFGLRHTHGSGLVAVVVVVVLVVAVVLLLQRRR